MVVGRRKDLPDADVTRVDQVGLGQQVAGREDCVAAGHGVQVGGGCIGGGHMGDQVWPVGLARLGEVGLVAAPVAAAFDARPGVEVVGVKDQQLAGGQAGAFDEVEDLLAGGQSGRWFAGHNTALNAANAAGYPCCLGD